MPIMNSVSNNKDEVLTAGLVGSDEDPATDPPKPPGVSTMGCIGFVLGAVVFMGILAWAVIYLGWMIYDRANNGSNENAELEETHAEKYQYIADAFAGEIENDDEHIELAGQFFDRINAFAATNSNFNPNTDDHGPVIDEFNSWLDLSRMKIRVVKTRLDSGLPMIGADDLGGFDAYLFQRQRRWILSQLQCETFDIAAVRPVGTETTCLVYAKLHYGNGRTAKVRIWVTNRNGRFRMFDYEMLDSATVFSLFVGIELCGAGSSGSIEQEMSIDENRRRLAQFQRQLNSAIREIRRGGPGVDNLGNTSQLHQQIDPKALDPIRLKYYWAASAVLYNQMAKYQDALKACLELRKLDPYMPQTCFLEANIFHEMGEHEKSIERCDKYQDLIGPDADALYLIGANYRGQNEIADATKAFQDALNLNPQHPQANRELKELKTTNQ